MTPERVASRLPRYLDEATWKALRVRAIEKMHERYQDRGATHPRPTKTLKGGRA